MAQLREQLKAELRDEVRAELIAELGGARPQPAPTAPKKTYRTDGLTRINPLVGSLKVAEGKCRTAADVDQAAKHLLSWFAKNPGSRIDEAAESLGVTVKDLSLPLTRLKEMKKLTKNGKLRGTTYSVKG